MTYPAAIAWPPAAAEPACFDAFLPLSRITGSDQPFAVQFGGAGSRAYSMCLRFGPLEPGDVVYGHLLVAMGARQDVIRDAVVWDHATRAFVLAVPRAIDQLAEQLDLTAAIFGGLGRFLSDAAQVVMDTLGALVRPSFFVVGGIGTIIGAFFMYYVVLYLLAHWAIWYVVVPCIVAGTVCAVIGEARHDRLRTALLATANGAFVRAQHPDRNFP